MDVIGDPAMLLPLLVPRSRPLRGKTLFVPHICDERRRDYTADAIGCDLIAQPETRSLEQLIALVRNISSVDFVLAGAMHAAIVAHAYGVPFAFFRHSGGYLDCPTKWADWMSGVTTAPVPIEFHSNMLDGMRWYLRHQERLGRCRLRPIVKAYAAVGDVRRLLAKRARAWDDLPSAFTEARKRRAVARVMRRFCCVSL